MSGAHDDLGPDTGQESPGLRARIANQAEDTIGRLADDLLENAVINSALQSAMSAREKVGQAQQSAMEALNLPTASDLEKLARRLRSISQRLEEVEDGVDRLGSKLEALGEASRTPAARLGEQLDRLDSKVEQLARDVKAPLPRPAARWPASHRPWSGSRDEWPAAARRSAPRSRRQPGSAPLRSGSRRGGRRPSRRCLMRSGARSSGPCSRRPGPPA
jgi:hypothetical protein